MRRCLKARTPHISECYIAIDISFFERPFGLGDEVGFAKAGCVKEEQFGVALSDSLTAPREPNPLPDPDDGLVGLEPRSARFQRAR
jgi:hypothetical protein